MRNVHFKFSLFLVILSLFCTGLMLTGQTAQKNQPATTPAAPPPAASLDASMNQIIDKICTREAALAARMKNLTPIVETYLQTLDKDDELTDRKSVV